MADTDASAVDLVLAANLASVTELSFAWLYTDDEYQVVRASRDLRRPTQWLVMDGGRFWQGSGSGGEDTEMPEGKFVRQWWEASTFPAAEAINTARTIANIRSAEVARHFNRMDQLVEEVRRVLPQPYANLLDGWGSDPRSGDVAVSLTTNGRGANMSCQINVFLWPYTPGDYQDDDPNWSDHISTLAEEFKSKCGWTVETNRRGVLLRRSTAESTEAAS